MPPKRERPPACPKKERGSGMPQKRERPPACPKKERGLWHATKKRERPGGSHAPAAVMQLLYHLTQCACTAFARSFLSCTAHTCGSSIFSMIGFGAGWAGAIGAVCGILACIGSSILMCCAPRTPQEGGGKFCAVRKSTPLAATPNPSPYAARAEKQNRAPPRRTGRCAAPHRWHHPADHVRHPSWPSDCSCNLSIPPPDFLR